MPCKYVRAPHSFLSLSGLRREQQQQNKHIIFVSDRAIKNRFSNIRDVDLSGGIVQLPIHGASLSARFFLFSVSATMAGQWHTKGPKRWYVSSLAFFYLLAGVNNKTHNKTKQIPTKKKESKVRKYTRNFVVNVDTQN
jgi:hypothetical protein